MSLTVNHRILEPEAPEPHPQPIQEHIVTISGQSLSISLSTWYLIMAQKLLPFVLLSN